MTGTGDFFLLIINVVFGMSTTKLLDGGPPPDLWSSTMATGKICWGIVQW